MRLPYINATRFAGYVGNVPELRKLPSGDATISLRIVAKESWNVGGEWRTHDEWATAIFYRALAEQVAAQGITKGSFVHVEGRRYTRRWGEESGKPKSSHEIIVDAWHEVVIAGVSKEKAPAPEAVDTAPAKPAAKAKRKPTPPPRSATEAFA